MSHPSEEMNPLFEFCKNPHQATMPFDELTPEMVLDAAKAGRDLAMKRIEELAKKDKIDIDELISKLDGISKEFSIVSALIYSLATTTDVDEYEELYSEIEQMGNALSKAMTNNPKIFALVNDHYQNADSRKYSKLTKRFLNQEYLSFLNTGAALDAKDQAKLKDIDDQLSAAASHWLKQYNAAMKDFKLLIKDEKELSGIPEEYLKAMKKTAEDAGADGYMITLGSSYSAVMNYAENRSLREKLWRVKTNLCNGGKFDNTQDVKAMVKLRLERAKLLGFDSHADLQMQDRMAGQKEAVFKQLEEVLKYAKPKAEEEFEILTKFAKEFEGKEIELKPWDTSYYMDQYAKKEFAFDSLELKQYLDVDVCMELLFEHQEKLLGITFEEVTDDYPTLDDDIRVLKVTDKESGNNLGLIYLDLYEKDGKMSGASASPTVQGTYQNGKTDRTLIMIRANFKQGNGDEPTTLSHYQLETFVHEVGHAVHGLVTKSPIRSLAGTSVAADFVELPSQINEKWFSDFDVLGKKAVHAKTGKKLPKELLDKMNKAKNFGSGMSKLSYLRRCYLDMHFHSDAPLINDDVLKSEKDFTKGLSLFEDFDTYESGRYDHLFDMPYCQYTAGYYVYLWADVLAADGYEFFKEKGLYDPKVAKAFKELLAAGGTVDAAELYKEFRGRDADVKPLLKEIGLIDEAANDDDAQDLKKKPMKPRP